MEVQKGKNIWEDLPEEWGDLPEKDESMPDESAKETSDREERQEIREEPSQSDVEDSDTSETNTVGDFKKDIATEPETNIATDSGTNTAEGQDTIGKRELRRRERKKIQEFDRRSREELMNDSEHARRAFDNEKEGNRRDFMIVGIVAAAVIVCIAAGVLHMTNASSQKIYNLIDQGNYSTAYREIEELYEKNKNVDSLVYAFAEKCVTDSEYKRAVASLEFLSSQAEDETDFFETIIEELLSHGKTNRAQEVLNYMQEQGGALSEKADELLTKYEDQF